MQKVRFLEPDEYPLLQEIFEAENTKLPSPLLSDIAVIEDENGEIISFAVAQLVCHIEPFWTHPQYQNQSLWRRCLQLIEKKLKSVPGTAAYISTMRPAQRKLLHREGFRDTGYQLLEKRY